MRYLIILLMILAITAYSQESMVTLSGGAVLANVEDAETNGTGFRINGLYEYNPMLGKIAYGLSVGYIDLGADNDGTEYKVTSLPIYFAPKFLFGGDKFKGFIKGALGMHFSRIKRTGTRTELEDKDTGFTGGIGGGALFFLTNAIFINAEYELLWMSNHFYRDGLQQGISAGLGFRF